MFLFDTSFWDKLPSYFHEEDTYKDGSNKGLLQRYLRIFGLELDESIVPYINNYLDQVDPKTASNNFLTHIAYALGNPLDIFSDASKFSLLLQYIMSIYKIKGTIKSYEVYFKLLGLTAYIVEHFDNINTYYDSGILYDTDLILYDSYCDSCSDYSIFFKDINQACLPSAPTLGSPLTIDPGTWTFSILTLNSPKIKSTTTSTSGWARYASLLTIGQLYKVTFTVTTTGSGFTPTVVVKLGTGIRILTTTSFTIGIPYTLYMYANGIQLEVNLYSTTSPGADYGEIAIGLTPATQLTWNYVLTPDLKTLLFKVIDFLEPIDDHLREFNEGITACENLLAISAEQITIVLLDPSLYDDAMNYDDANLYDTDAVISTTVVNQP